MMRRVFGAGAMVLALWLGLAGPVAHASTEADGTVVLVPGDTDADQTVEHGHGRDGRTLEQREKGFYDCMTGTCMPAAGQCQSHCGGAGGGRNGADQQCTDQCDGMADLCTKSCLAWNGF